MNKYLKALLIIEVIICFTPISLIWLLGLLFLPNLIPGPFYEPAALFGVMTFTALVAVGGIGLTCLFAVASYLLYGKEITQIRKYLLTGMGLACLPLLVMLLTSNGIAWKINFLMPLACTAHLVYLARDQFFTSCIK